ncbi:Uncharacterized protein HZ326_2303 [Fusarium oxysporum f. sp. albedinis]|nr:Uncharacterized protein HZ326_2303 [Fusarium oxysporum f. sp. albedinis]
MYLPARARITEAADRATNWPNYSNKNSNDANQLSIAGRCSSRALPQKYDGLCTDAKDLHSPGNTWWIVCEEVLQEQRSRVLSPFQNTTESVPKANASPSSPYRGNDGRNPSTVGES